VAKRLFTILKNNMRGPIAKGPRGLDAERGPSKLNPGKGGPPAYTPGPFEGGETGVYASPGRHKPVPDPPGRRRKGGRRRRAARLVWYGNGFTGAKGPGAPRRAAKRAGW